MRFLKLTLAYDGTEYAGWQVQPGARTIQGELERAIEAVTGQQRRAIASGRTDAGVHAYGQAVSIALESTLACDVLARALCANLPQDIVVLDACEAPEGFHAIRDARRKRYRYVIDDGPQPDVLARRYAWRVRQPLDEGAMHRAALALLGEHDFAGFEAAGSERATTVRTINDIWVARRTAGAGEIDFGKRVVLEVEANGFLYNMVRNIVGSLVEIGRGSQPESWLFDILSGKDRKLAGPTAPPQGLFLVSVTYGEW